MKSSRFILWLILLSLVITTSGFASEGQSSKIAIEPVIKPLSPNHVQAGSADSTLTVRGDDSGSRAVTPQGGAALRTARGNLRETWEGHGSNFAIGPIIRSVSPNLVQAGSPGFTLVVKGRHFGPSSVVLCDGSALPTDWGSSLELRVQMPASDLGKPGILTITVQNHNRHSNPKQVTVADPKPPLPLPVKVMTTGLPNGQVGTVYHASLAATGGQQPYHWSVTSGSLPGGVSLSESGQFSGSPVAKGSFPITVHVQDSSSPSSSNSPSSSGDSRALTISVAAAPPAPSPLLITTTSLPGGQQGLAYATTSLTAVGGTQTYHWSVLAGALPSGLVLSDSGQLSGVPKASGNFPVTFQVKDSTSPIALTDSKLLTISVVAAPPAPSPVKITTTGLPNGQVGSAYPTTSLAASGGTQPYHWSVVSGALPNGLLLSDGGQLSGTPKASGSFPVTIQVKDSTSPNSSTDSKPWTINIAAAPPAPSPVKITTTSLPSGQVGSAYPTTALAATGGTQPYTWSLAPSSGPLPNGLALSSSGQISGNPTTAGAFPMTFQVRDSATPTPSTDSAALSISIAPNQPPSAGSGALTIFFTDLLSGPNTGGEGNNGAFVYIYGKGFGAARGSSTVTVGGGQVASYRVWGQNNAANNYLDLIVVQLGPNASTGNIVVHTAAGDSNSVPFTVRPGNIYFVSPSGNDGNPGTFAQPFATPVQAKNVMQPGDITYFRAGTYSGADNFGSIVSLSTAGTPGNPIAYVGYPGEVANFDATGQTSAFYDYASNLMEWLIIAELHGTAPYAVVRMEGTTHNHFRLIGNDFTCTGSCETFNVEGPAIDHRILGNNMHDTGRTGGATFDARAYSMYYGGYGAQSDIEIGWNALHDNPFGKGLQIYGHQAGDSFTNFRIHDNAVYNNTMPGFTIGGSDGGTDVLGSILIQNNLFWNNGGGHISWRYGGIQIQSLSGNDGDFTVLNNTFYDNGAPHGSVGPGGQIMFAHVGVKSLVLKNNILYSKSGETTFFFDDSSAPTAARITGSNNLYFGDSPAPSFDPAAVTADPLFVSLGTFNFRLQAGSPAIDKGVNTGIPFDFDGVPRPQGAGYDIGAFEFKK